MGNGNSLAGSENPKGVKRIHFKAPERLVDSFDEKHENRTEALVSLMRRDLDKPEPTTERQPFTPPTDDKELARAYELLFEHSSGNGWIHEEEAKSLLATRLSIKESHTYGRIVKPLRQRGYLSRISDALEGGRLASLLVHSTEEEP